MTQDFPPVRKALECTPRAGLPNFFAKVKTGGEYRIAYLGGSITAQTGWRVKSLAYLNKKYPNCKFTEINAAIGAVGGTVEAEAKIVAMVARSPAPLPQKLSVLLRLAAGETAPLGPAADRAKAEAVKLFRAPESRAVLSAAPESLAPLRGLMQAAGLAA